MFNETPAAGAGHSEMLDILARARPDRLKHHAETLLFGMGDITVIANRTGLVMVPMRDTVKNVDFHLGEVLVSEAHITDAAGHVGYGMVTGRDLERAMAMAVVDLSTRPGRCHHQLSQTGTGPSRCRRRRTHASGRGHPR